MRKVLLAGVALAAFAAYAAGPARAETATANMTVQATATATCTVAAGVLDFGSYNGTSNVDGSATITVDCGSVEPSNSVYVTFGLGSHAETTQRRMADGTATQFLNYNLYSDSGRTTALGDTDQLPVTLSLNTGEYGGEVTVYGRVPSGQNVKAGTYTDTVVVTLNY
ncbi:MAG: spore coat protein U domain-containing protein [Rhodospirillales bacterium]|nr:spore coat protein U domain-containing protein [Rhodospirillales bacterium]